MKKKRQNDFEPFKATMHFLWIYWLFLGIFAVPLFLIPKNGELSMLAGVLVSLMWLIGCLYFPIVSLGYGVRAFLRTREIFYPCLVFFLALLVVFLIFCIVSSVIASAFGVDFFGSNRVVDVFYMVMFTLFLSLFSLPIALVTSVISSVITKFVVKRKQRLCAPKDGNGETDEYYESGYINKKTMIVVYVLYIVALVVLLGFIVRLIVHGNIRL